MAKKPAATNKKNTLPGAAKTAATQRAADKPTPAPAGSAGVTASTVADQQPAPNVAAAQQKRSGAARQNEPPRPATASGRHVTAEQIARRAYEIYASGQGGTPDENWHQAERELRGG